MQDADFLNLISEQPDNATNKLVYADYLEESGRTQQAEFLRLWATDLDAVHSWHEARAKKQRLQDLRKQLHPDWLAAMDSTKLENCGRRHVDWSFQCSLRWEELSHTDDPAVRHCDGCDRPVYHCGSVEEACAHARQDRCVAVNSLVLYDPKDIERVNRPTMVMGEIAVEFPQPRVSYAPGDAVIIIAGTFAGTPGEFIDYAGWNLRPMRATVEIQRFGKTVRVEIPLAELGKAAELVE